MKIKNRIFLDFILIIIVITIGMSFLLTFQQNISLANEYHEKMSIPGINAIFLMSQKFQGLYQSTLEYLLEDEEAKQRYSQGISELNEVYDEYAEVALSKRDSGEYVGPPMMRKMMLDFGNQQNEASNRTDAKIQELFSLIESGAPVTQIQKQFDSINREREVFQKINEKNLQMESMGKDKQKQIVSENLTNSYMTIVLMIVSLGIIMGVIFVQTSRNISNPIIRLRDTAKQITEKGLNVQVKSEGDHEIAELAYSFNEMIHHLEKYQEELKSIDKQKDEFVAMISHELKTPMTPIKIYSSALKRPKMLGELNEKQKEAVDSIHFNALRLERTVADLLDAQKLELGKMKFEKKEMKVEELMKQITTNLEKQTEQKGGQLINHTTEKITIKSDAPRLAQVLTNLINNAIDFIPENTGKIEINAQKKGGEVLFSVKDNGTGMTLETQQNLFQKFYKADTSITRKHGGTGLGLSICKGIVEALRGEIWFESEEGKGTTFYFTTQIGDLQ